MLVRGWRKLRNRSCVDALDHFLEKIGNQELVTVHMYLQARTSVDPHITLFALFYTFTMKKVESTCLFFILAK